MDQTPAAAGPASNRHRFAQLTQLVEDSVVGELLSEVRRTRLLDMAYTLAAQFFVALIPLVLVVTAMFTSSSDDAYMADELVQRFGLVGAAREAVRQLFQTPGAGSGIYWTGVLITLLSAFSLARRVGRVYASVWEVPALPAGQQWRGLIWVLIQVGMVLLASGLRGFGRQHGSALEIVALLALLLVWGGTEYGAQWIMTAGQVPRDRLLVAAGVVSLGRLGVAVWSNLYLPGTLSRQSEQFGPIGVVFGLFTWIFVSVLVMLGATLIGAVLTRRPVQTWLRPAPAQAPTGPAAPAAPA